jgi:hypothetical protein
MVLWLRREQRMLQGASVRPARHSAKRVGRELSGLTQRVTAMSGGAASRRMAAMAAVITNRV